MGQILDRIINFGKSYRNNNSDFQKILEEEDNELKNIINELNNSTNKNQQNPNYHYTKTEYNNNPFNSKTKSNFNNYKSNSNKNNTKEKNIKYIKEIQTAFIELEMEPNDDIQVIKSQYKKLIKLYHPDKINLDDKSLNDAHKASKINNSYNILKKFYKF